MQLPDLTKFRKILWSVMLVGWLVFGLVFGVLTMFKTQHRNSVADQNSAYATSSHFWQALNGDRAAPAGPVGQFVRDMGPLIIKAQDDYSSGLASDLPDTITKVKIPENKYQNVAYLSRTPIFGVALNTDGSTVTDDRNDPNYYVEGGKFDSDFLAGIAQIVDRTSGISAYTEQPQTPLGTGHPIVAWWVYVGFFFALSALAYVLATTDYDNEKIMGNKVNLLNLTGRYKVIYWMVLAPVFLLQVGKTTWILVSFRHEQNAMLKRLADPDKPMITELKTAQELLVRMSKNKMQHLPEVQAVTHMIQETLRMLDRAATHKKENEARRDAMDAMEQIVPIAGKAKQYHDDLKEEMTQDVTAKFSVLREQIAEHLALGAGNAEEE